MELPIEAKLWPYVQKVLGKDPSGHGLDHIQRVVRTTKTLLEETPKADATIAICAAMLHDTYDRKLVPDVAAAKAKTQSVMALAGLSSAQQQAILAIIDHMSFRENLTAHQALSLEGQLVQDADRLDAIGAIGIARTMYYGGAHNSKLYDPAIPPRTQLDTQNYAQPSTVIDHFYEKLLKLADQMNTPAAQKLAQGRQQVMRQYLKAFYSEWAGKS